MVTTHCDVCKKKVDDPFTGRTFFYFSKYNVCESCRDGLDAQLRNHARGKDPFSFEWFGKLTKDMLEKGVQKGKI